MGKERKNNSNGNEGESDGNDVTEEEDNEVKERSFFASMGFIYIMRYRFRFDKCMAQLFKL